MIPPSLLFLPIDVEEVDEDDDDKEWVTPRKHADAVAISSSIVEDGSRRIMFSIDIDSPPLKC